MNSVLQIVIISSFFILFPLAFIKTYTHFKYRKLSRGEKSRGLLNPLFFSPYMFGDWFTTLFFLPTLKKHEDEELEKMRRFINRIVCAIYICLILLIVGLLIKQRVS